MTEIAPLPDRLLAALDAAGGRPRTADELIDWVRAEDGRRVSRGGRTAMWLRRFAAAGLVVAVERGPRKTPLWTVTP